MSDGAATPAQVADALLRSDLAVAGITDHDTVEGALRVREALAGRGPEVIIGTEVTSADGHILALFVDRDVPPRLSARETVEIIHELGGLAIAAHPYFPAVGVGDLAAELPFDGVEVANGTPFGELANRRAARRLGPGARAVLGGSDAHLAVAIGHFRTRFPGGTAADLRSAIEGGQTQPELDWATHVRLGPRMLCRVAWTMAGETIEALQARIRTASPPARRPPARPAGGPGPGPAPSSPAAPVRRPSQ